MLPILRRQRIMEILKEKGTVKVKELSQALGVSAMTVHRDLDFLERQGLLVKVHGGAATPPVKEHNPRSCVLSSTECQLCGVPVLARMAFQLILDDGTRILACCQHCGLLLYLQHCGKVHSVMTHDFVTLQKADALSCYYLFYSSVTPCCAPSILAFINRETAEKFQLGFGGEILTFEEMVERMKKIRERLAASCQ